MSKRTIRKRKKRRGLRLGLLSLLAALAILVAALSVSLSADPREEASQTGDDLWDGSWYEDDLGRVQRDRALVRGLKAFEKRTGIKPYLSLQEGIDPEELDLFTREQYEALFTEGEHLLVVYDEWGEGEYYLSARVGEGSALTQADLTRLLSCLEKAYADPANKTYADAFGAGFRQGAREMSVRRERDGVGLLLALGLMLVALSVVLFLFLRKRARGVAWEGQEG